MYHMTMNDVCKHKDCVFFQNESLFSLNYLKLFYFGLLTVYVCSAAESGWKYENILSYFIMISFISHYFNMIQLCQYGEVVIFVGCWSASLKNAQIVVQEWLKEYILKVERINTVWMENTPYLIDKDRKYKFFWC